MGELSIVNIFMMPHIHGVIASITHDFICIHHSIYCAKESLVSIMISFWLIRCQETGENDL